MIITVLLGLALLFVSERALLRMSASLLCPADLPQISTSATYDRTSSAMNKVGKMSAVCVDPAQEASCRRGEGPCRSEPLSSWLMNLIMFGVPLGIAAGSVGGYTVWRRRTAKPSGIKS